MLSDDAAVATITVASYLLLLFYR